MTRRRGNHGGTIFRRQDGRWCGIFELGRDVTGKRRRLAFYGTTRQAVQERLAKAAHDNARGLLADPTR